MKRRDVKSAAMAASLAVTALMLAGKTAVWHVTRLEDDLRALFPQGQTHITAHLKPTHAHGDHPDGHEAPEDPLYAAAAP